MTANIQNAIGIEYVSLEETSILKWPSVTGSIFSSMFNLMIVVISFSKPGADVVNGRQSTEGKTRGSRVKRVLTLSGATCYATRSPADLIRILALNREFVYDFVYKPASLTACRPASC